MSRITKIKIDEIKEFTKRVYPFIKYGLVNSLKDVITVEPRVLPGRDFKRIFLSFAPSGRSKENAIYGINEFNDFQKIELIRMEDSIYRIADNIVSDFKFKVYEGLCCEYPLNRIHGVGYFTFKPDYDKFRK